MKPMPWISGLLALGMITGLVGYTAVLSDGADPNPGQSHTETGPALSPETGTTTAGGQASDSGWEQRVRELAARLSRDYGATIDEAATQAYLFVEREKLADADPQQGRALFDEAVARAFPTLTASIRGLMADMDEYRQWLTENDLTLREMALMERRAAIWQQREAIFGAKASAIWGDEESVATRNADAIRAELARLDQAHELTPEEVAHQLSTTTDSVYGLEAAGQLVTPQAMGQALFSMASVQADLETMPAGERQQRIDALRRQMGYREEDVQRLGQLDRQRNQRWQEGEDYMAERRQLSGQYQGEQLRQALEDLRQAYFGDTALTIAREEQQGFFRFERERRYGLN